MVASHGNEVVWVTILVHNGHDILIALLQIFWLILVLTAELLGCLLPNHLHFVDLAGLDSVKCGHAIHGINPHATVSYFSWETKAFGLQSWPTDPQHTAVSTCNFQEMGWKQHEW